MTARETEISAGALAAEPSPPAKKYQLGVLLVHGIGSQPAGDTLVRWGDVLIKTIQRASHGRVQPVVEQADLAAGDGTRPEAVIRIRTEHGEESWLFAEGWWAGAFPAASYRELVSWSIRALPWSISLHFAQRYWAVAQQRRSAQKVIAVVGTLGQLLFGLALAPIAIAMLLLTLLLAWVPVPQLRALLAAIQSSLTSTVGDSLAFVESPLRAALIRTRLLAAIRRVEEECARCLVVAHSQGAAAVLDVLGGIVEPSGNRAEEPAAPEGMPTIDTLLTFGAGTNQLVSLKVMSSRAREKDDVAQASPRAVVGIVAFAAVVGWIVYQVRTKHFTLSAIAEAAMYWFAGVLGIMLAAWLAGSVAAGLARRVEWIRVRERTVTPVAMMVMALVVLVGFIVFADSKSAAFGSITWLMLAFIFLVGGVAAILSKTLRDVVSNPVRKPPRVGQWIDIAATADPVSNGPTRVRNESDRTFLPVWNQGSAFRDHTTYWSNLDGFVLRVARICAETAGSAWREALPRENPAIDERAKWRLGHLTLVRWCTALIWLLLLPLLWMWDGYAIPLDIPAWLPAGSAGVTRLVLLPILLALVAAAHLALQTAIWNLWVERDQRHILQRQVPDPNHGYALFGMFVCQLLPPLFVLRQVCADIFAPAENPLLEPQKVVLCAFSFAVLVSALLFWRNKPPPWRVAT